MSPYKDKEKARNYAKGAMKRRREGITGGITKEGITSLGITHPVMKWLIGEKRDKLEKIVQGLKRHNVLRNSYLGAGVHSLPMEIVAEMLEVTQCR